MTQTETRFVPQSQPDPPPAVVEWWRRPWMIPLVVLIGAFLFYVLPNYVHLDPDQSLVALNPKFPIHYGVVLTHVFAGSIAQLTVCLQVWTWLREKAPKVHRVSGWIYTFAGAIPAAIAGLILDPLVVPRNGAVGAGVLGIMWLITTIAGFVTARQRKWQAHRKWMIYSFALGLSPIWGRVFNIIILAFFPSQLTNFTLLGLVAEAGGWIGWVINLIIAVWWLNRTPYPYKLVGVK